MDDQNPANCTYHLDSQYRITYLSPNWTSFAADNEADDLETGKVVGTSIWDHITGDGTASLYRALLNRVTTTKSEFRFRFRCDGPEIRRFMELSIAYQDCGVYEFSSKLVRSENRTYQRLLAKKAPRSRDSLLSCAWCRKFSLPNSQWVEVEEAVEDLNLFEHQAVPSISHGICPDCKSNLTASIK